MTNAAATPGTSAPSAAEQAQAVVLEAQDWFRDKEFTTDWVTNKIRRWHRFLRRFRDRPVDLLEVGSFEGRSALFFLNYLPQSRLTCIDLFPGPLEARFDRNMQGFGDRLTKIKGSAIAHLDRLAGEKRQYHFIYLDAGKKRDHVLAQALLTWPLLRPGGLLMIDDYDWGKDRPPEGRPHDAINIFLDLHKDEIEILWKDGQVILKRLVPPPPAAAA